jgi:hypothetical protein
MEPVTIAQIRWDSVGDQCVVIMDLSRQPDEAWREYCSTNLDRFASAFAGQPLLGRTSLSVELQSDEFALADRALQQVIEITNQMMGINEASN